MSGKEVVDALLRLVEILVSWPVLVLIVILYVRRDLPTLISKLSDRITKAPGGFEFAVLRQEVQTLSTKVDKIAEEIRFRPSAALTPEVQDILRASFVAFRDYLLQLGYTPEGGQVDIYVDPDEQDNAYYDGQRKLIVIGKPLASDPDVALREYTHHALLALIGESFAEWARDYREIESGLADYFPCSFNNDPLFAARLAREKLQRPYLRNLANERTFSELADDPNRDGVPQTAGEIWGGAFWDLRAQLGQAATDQLLFSTWAAVQPSVLHRAGAATFVRKLAATASSSGNSSQVEHVHAVFKRRELRF